MNPYRFVAVNAAGALVRGEQNAESEADLEDRLARQQLELLSAQPARRAFGRGQRRLPVQELVYFDQWGQCDDTQPLVTQLQQHQAALQGNPPARALA